MSNLDFASSGEMLSHYAAIKRRLYNPVLARPHFDPAPVRVGAPLDLDARGTDQFGWAAPIVARVAREHDVAPGDLIGDLEEAHLLRARQHALFELRRLHPDRSFQVLGQLFAITSGSAHWSISHHAERIVAGKPAVLPRQEPVPLPEPPPPPPPEPSRITVPVIQRAVAAEFGLSVSFLCGPTRTAAVVRPRQFAMALACRLTTLSLPEIGRRFGGRDHTTALHSRRRMQATLDTVELLVSPSARLSDWVGAGKVVLSVMERA